MVDPVAETTWIESGFSHYIIIGCSVVGLAWGTVNAVFVSIHPSVSD